MFQELSLGRDDTGGGISTDRGRESYTVTPMSRLSVSALPHSDTEMSHFKYIWAVFDTVTIVAGALEAANR